MKAKAHALLANFIDLLLDAICVVDKEGRFVFVSAACERIFGYTPEEMLGRRMIELVAPEDQARTLQAAAEIMAGQAKFNFENRYVRKDGRLVHIMWSARWSEADQLRVAVARDITSRKHAESMQAALYAISEAAHGAEDMLALFQQIHQIIGQLLPALNFSVVTYDEKNDRLSSPYHINQFHPAGAAQAMPASALCAEVIRSGQPLLLNPQNPGVFPADLHGPDGTEPLCWLGVPLNSHKGTIGALVLMSYAGGALYAERDKELLQFVSTQVATAIEHKQLHARLRRLAQYDELTDLPNRGLLYDRLDMALARARREQGRMSLLYVDLDKFKQVNDSHGHATGDLLLQEVAHRLKQCVRETDTVARMGGDEFVVLLENVQLPQFAAQVADKIRKALAQPVHIDGLELYAKSSIGIACYPEHGLDARLLLKHADEAMYQAKKSTDEIRQKEDC